MLSSYVKVLRPLLVIPIATAVVYFGSCVRACCIGVLVRRVSVAGIGDDVFSETLILVRGTLGVLLRNLTLCCPSLGVLVLSMVNHGSYWRLLRLRLRGNLTEKFLEIDLMDLLLVRQLLILSFKQSKQVSTWLTLALILDG